ncbi:MAG: alpha-amylase family glycosyl hydrolase [Bacteroidota bacterium]
MRRSLFLPFLLLAAATATAQPLTIDKVEPPNWWAGMNWNDIQLMVYGEDLAGATARFTDPRLRVTATHTLEHPGYLFVDVTIPDDLPAGTYTLEVIRGDETATMAYPIEARQPMEGRYQGFDNTDVVYLLTPDRFANGDPSNDDPAGVETDFDRSDPNMRHGGDLQGMIDRLDYLADLGVTAVWPNPVLHNDPPLSYHGYKAVDLYQIDPRFGTNDDYRRFVQEAHDRDIKVIFDHINNHIGVTHPWIDAMPRASWFNGTKDDHLGSSHYKLAPVDPYADPESAEQLRTFWFVPEMPDLNQRDPFVATYLTQNMLWWIETTGLDGIREDTYPYPDQDFLADWAEAILDEYPDFNIVGEIWEYEPSYLALFQTESYLPRDFETNLPSVMDFPLSLALRNYLTGDGRLSAVYTLLAQDFIYTDPDNLFTFIDNHDMPRGIFIAEGDTDRLKQATAILLTTRGIPQILYGNEINMMGDESHVELRADFPGGWPGDERDAFTEAGRTAEENDIFNFTRALLNARLEHPALTEGELVQWPSNAWGPDVYRYLRHTDDETVAVLVNGNDEPMALTLSGMEPYLAGCPVLTDLLTGTTHDPADGEIDVPAGGVAVALCAR